MENPHVVWLLSSMLDGSRYWDIIFVHINAGIYGVIPAFILHKDRDNTGFGKTFNGKKHIFKYLIGMSMISGFDFPSTNPLNPRVFVFPICINVPRCNLFMSCH